MSYTLCIWLCLGRSPSTVLESQVESKGAPGLLANPWGFLVDHCVSTTTPIYYNSTVYYTSCVTCRMRRLRSQRARCWWSSSPPSPTSSWPSWQAHVSSGMPPVSRTTPCPLLAMHRLATAACRPPPRVLEYIVGGVTQKIIDVFSGEEAVLAWFA